MRPCRAPSVAHITNVLPARHTVTLLYAEFRQMGVASFDAMGVFDLDQLAIARGPARVGDHAIGCRKDICTDPVASQIKQT